MDWEFPLLFICDKWTICLIRQIFTLIEPGGRLKMILSPQDCSPSSSSIFFSLTRSQDVKFISISEEILLAAWASINYMNFSFISCLIFSQFHVPPSLSISLFLCDGPFIIFTKTCDFQLNVLKSFSPSPYVFDFIVALTLSASLAY